MAQLPTGTVTFLFTDIEGSTRLARGFPEAWPTLRMRHQALVEAAVTQHHGAIFRTVGDEFNIAFETALDALQAAVAAQQALQREDWGVIGALHVRMGMHTGPARWRGDEYDGYLTLSHTKRLMSAAAGDQILLSEATEALLRDALPQGLALRDLGGYRLKDFERVEPIYQVVAPDLPAEFPPLKAAPAAPTQLPVQLTSFVGRAREIEDVQRLLSEERLLTLTGPSGSGKTRLAVQAAGQVSEQFPDGVFFVALASIRDAGLVPAAIAQALGIPETAGQSIVESIQDTLQGKTILLVLDNFEQVIAVAPLVADVLMACTGVKMLVTSREALRIRGEREYPVPPLALPDLTHLPPLDALTQVAAVQLFLQRAVAVRPDFKLTPETAPAVAEICHRLDGLPLAIELAAARIKLLAPPALLARLQHRLEFLTGGARDLPARQQTLRDAIAWSYDLLGEDERTLFRRLSVFVGGGSIHAVEAVAADPSTQAPLLDLLGSLVDKSLLNQVEGVTGDSRLGMLETLREFGLEQLQASGEEDAVRRRHAEFFLALAEQAETKLASAGQIQWVQQMEQEHDNLRAAFEWSQTVAGATELSLRFAAALGLFWEARGYISEGRERLSALLQTLPAVGAGQRPAAHARVLARAAELAYRQSDFSATTAFAEESLAIYRAVGDQPGIASTLVKLGNAAEEMGAYAAAAGFLEEALRTWRDLGDRHGVARALISLGWAALRTGDFPLARSRLEEAFAISRQLNDVRSMGFELAGLGEVALRQGDVRRASQLVEESLELRKRLGHQWGIGVSLGILGWIAMREGHWQAALLRFDESLEIRQAIGDQSGCAWCVEHLAEVALAQGQPEKAVRLFGAGAALRASIHSVVDPVDRPEYDRTLQAMKAAVGEGRFTALWDEGRGMTLPQAIADALATRIQGIQKSE
jgi:predicted ATPase/class 3 adenylate cyclase